MQRGNICNFRNFYADPMFFLDLITALTFSQNFPTHEIGFGLNLQISYVIIFGEMVCAIHRLASHSILPEQAKDA